jgi:hypothetical protein
VGGFAVAAVAGVLQAEIAYVPSLVEVKPRAVPSVALAPRVLPASEGRGGIVGLSGRF